MSRDQRRWTPAEDALLREGYRLQAAAPAGKGRTINWSDIAKMIPGRSNKDCRKRYFNEVSGCLKKGPWTEEEDTRLKGYVQQSGLSWALIAQKMENRSADQCSKRWHHCLDPALDRRQWTDEEVSCPYGCELSRQNGFLNNQFLLTAIATHGNSWKDIQMIHFPTRSANNVKNQYTILARKVISVPPDAPPCCPQRSHPTPVSYCSETSSQVSTPRPTEGSSYMAMDHNFFSLESTNSSCHLLHDSSPMDLVPLQDEMSTPSFGLGRSDRWGSSGHELGSIFPSSEFVDMSELDGPGFNVSSSTSGFETRKGEFDAISLSLDREIGGLGTDPTSNGLTRSGKLRGNDSQDALEHALMRHSNGGEGRERALSDSRITITIDDAEPETVMGVMKVLVQSRAKVEFHRR